MNDHLQQELAAWLSRLREATDAGASFALEQAPLLVQEKVLYGRALFTAAAVLAVLTLLSGAVLMWRGLRMEESTDYDVRRASAAYEIFGMVGLGAGALLLMGTASPFLKVWFAPRLYVLEWLAGLLK